MKTHSTLLLFFLCLATTVNAQLFSPYPPLTAKSGVINIDSINYKEDNTLSWVIDIGEPGTITFTIDVTLSLGSDMIYIFDYEGEFEPANFIGAFEGVVCQTVSTTWLNGKAFIRLVSMNGYDPVYAPGGTIHYTFSPNMVSNNTIVNNNLSVGTAETVEKLTLNGNFSLGINKTWAATGAGDKLWFRGVNSSFNDMHMYRYNGSPTASELRLNISDTPANEQKFKIGNFGATTSTYFSVVNNGRVGINTENPQQTLDVNGTIRAKQILITETGWADFVFAKDYRLPTLESVKAHIDEYNTLPGIPSEKEIKAQGVNLTEMNVKLLQKIEELTLYILDQEKRIKEQNKRITELEKNNKR